MKNSGLLALIVLSIHMAVFAQTSRLRCSGPLPHAEFYVESQPDSPVLIRDFKAELVRNPNDSMGYNQIRITFYFQNRSKKKIGSYYWDNPMPDESKWPSGGGSWKVLLPGESERYSNIFHTQNGPPVVFRITGVKFDDKTEWKSRGYKKAEVMNTSPICVVPEEWPTARASRTLRKSGWAEPIFADRILNVIDAGTETIGGINVSIKLYEIKNERLDELESCPPGDLMGRIAGDKSNFDYDVEKYRSFSVNGRVFAYLVNYEYVDEANQTRIGAGSSSFYIDKDGSGKFTLDCSAGNITPSVPKWIRGLSKP